MNTAPVTEKNAMASTLQACNHLMQEKDFHRQKSTEYFRMFNELVPETDPQMTGCKNSPLQEFFQRRAEHHAQQMFLIDARIEELSQAVYNTTIID